MMKPGEIKLMMSYDPHAERAAQVFGVPLSEVTEEQRQVGKLRNYADMYGALYGPPRP